MYLINRKILVKNRPFGMAMSNRKFTQTNKNYRYNFNGKEQDKETTGTTTYDYGFRIYNPALGRFLSVDPLTYSYPYYTPYQFAGNMPIAAIDLDGLEQYVVTYYKDQHGTTSKIEVRAYFLNDGSIQDQDVHKMKYQTKDGEESAVPDGGKIAKGNVLVFEVRNEGAKNESISIVDERNRPNSALTKQELGVFNKYKKIEGETDEVQQLAYPNTGLDAFYQSKDLENKSTKSYTAIFNKQPAQFKLNASFQTYTTKLSDEKNVKKQLANTVQYLKENPTKVLVIAGNVGCDDPNLNCTATMTLDGKTVTNAETMRKRAETIRGVLIKMGVSPSQVKAVEGKMVYTPPNSGAVPVDVKIQNK
jgi:RHS repeat-associated protein